MLLSIDKQYRITIPKSVNFIAEKEFFINNEPGSFDTVILSPKFFRDSIKCHLDDRRRFILPSILRKTLKVAPRSILEMTYSNDGCILIKKLSEPKSRCIFCDSNLGNTYVVYNGEKVCPKCLSSLKKLTEALPI